MSFSASQLARRHLLFFSHDSGYKETLLSAKRLGLLFSPIVCFVPCILPITIFLLERIQAPWGQNSLSTEFERRPALRGVRCRWERRRCAVAPNSWRRHKAELALVAGGITRSFPRTPDSDPVFISVRFVPVRFFAFSLQRINRFSVVIDCQCILVWYGSRTQQLMTILFTLAVASLLVEMAGLSLSPRLPKADVSRECGALNYASHRTHGLSTYN